VFDPGWLVFVPYGKATVGEVTVQPGMAAPGQSEELLKLRPQLASARWGTEDGSDGSAGPPKTDATSTLVVNGTPIGRLHGHADDTGITDPSMLDKLAAAVPTDAETTTGVVVSQAARGAVIVPAASIYNDRVGHACTIWRTEASREHRARVAVIDTPIGEALISGLPAAAVEVRLDPPKTARRVCGR
jgi:hypothetical protein